MRYQGACGVSGAPVAKPVPIKTGHARTRRRQRKLTAVTRRLAGWGWHADLQNEQRPYCSQALVFKAKTQVLLPPSGGATDTSVSDPEGPSERSWGRAGQVQQRSVGEDAEHEGQPSAIQRHTARLEPQGYKTFIGSAACTSVADYAAQRLIRPTPAAAGHLVGRNKRNALRHDGWFPRARLKR